MARRIGSEVVEYWRARPPEFNEPRRYEKVTTWHGCWVNFPIGADGEGVNGNDAVMSSAPSFWIPYELSVFDAEDYLVWTRHPNERYGVNGEPARLVDRRGRLRANVVPTERIASEVS